MANEIKQRIEMPNEFNKIKNKNKIKKDNTQKTKGAYIQYYRQKIKEKKRCIGPERYKPSYRSI